MCPHAIQRALAAEDLQVFVYASTEYAYDPAERYEEFKGCREKPAKAEKNTSSSMCGDDD